MKTFRVSAVLAAALLVSLVAPRAHADSKAWTTAKSVIPGDMFVVAGGNVATIRKSTIYQTLVPSLLQKEQDAKQGLEMIKTDCGIDVEAAITDVVVAVNEKEKGLIVAAVSGVDADKVTACLQKMADKDSKGKITTKTSGKVTEYSMSGQKDKLYLAWLDKDVVAMATDPTDKSLLDKMIGGKGAVAKSGDLAKALGKVNTNAAIWMAMAKKTPIGDAKKKATMKAAYGALDLAAGVVSLAGNIVLSSAAEATMFADEMNKQMATQSAQLPPDIQKIMKSVKVAAKDAEVQITMSMTEKDVLSLIGLAMTQM